jgi:hypothetical protein
MGRQIDLTKKLNEEDRSFLLERGRYTDVARNDEEFSGKASKAAAAPPEGGQGDEGGDWYEDEGVTKAQLQAELESRQLGTSGNKAELVARLREHDAGTGE